MEVFSHYGVGIKAFAIERKSNGRVEFTLWATVFFIPVWPLSSWSAIYIGPVRPDSIKEDGHLFDDPVHIQRDFISNVQTLSTSLLMLALAIAPIAYLIWRTSGRAATPIELIFVFAACVWPIVVIIFVESYRCKLLNGAKT